MATRPAQGNIESAISRSMMIIGAWEPGNSGWVDKNGAVQDYRDYKSLVHGPVAPQISVT